MGKLINAAQERERFAANLRNLLEKKGKSQSDMSRETEIGISTINSWMIADKYPGLKNQQIIADYFGVTRSDLMDNDVKKIVPRAVAIPVLGSIACGQPIFCEENIEEYKYRYSKRFTTNDTYYYLRAKGDSMTPTIPDKSLVLIRSQSTVNNGEIAACVIGEEKKLTLKRFKRHGNTIILTSDNSNHEPIVIDIENEDSIKIVGKAISCEYDL